MPNTWIIEQTKDTVLVTRRKPVRWDVSATATFPTIGRTRLAHQIRQDMWRLLQNQRGFSPAVLVTNITEGLTVTAGGQIDSSHNKARIKQQIGDLLASPPHRARWIRCATPRGVPNKGARSIANA